MIKISVIIPVYNAERYLYKCLDSVLNQTFSELEIICVDDCSTDSSLKILEEYQKKDSRIRLLQNERNLQVAETRNIGLNHATGTYVYFIDADDYIDPNYLQDMYSKATETDADIVMNTNILTHAGEKVTEYVHPSMPEVPFEGSFINRVTAIDKSNGVVWMRLFKRTLLENNQVRFPKVTLIEDAVFHYIANFYASSIFAFRAPSAYHYILHDDSVTGVVKENNQRDLQTMKAYDLVYDYLKDRDLLEKNKAKLFNVSGFFKVDTAEKFELYRSYFSKIKEDMDATSDRYNAIDIFFAQSILSVASFDEYRSQYPASVAIAFIKNGKKGK